MIGAARLAVAALLGAVLPAAAQFAPCEGAEPFEATLRHLEADGWSVHPAGRPLPADAAERLAWALAVGYLAGDRGGETPEAIVALQRAAVPGLARKVDTDATRSRVLTRDDGAMILTDTELRPGEVERTCQVALDAAVTVPPGVLGFDGRTLDGAPRTLAVTHVVVETVR